MTPQKDEVYQHKHGKKRILVLAAGEYEVLYQVLTTPRDKAPIGGASYSSCTIEQFERDYVLAKNTKQYYA